MSDADRIAAIEEQIVELHAELSELRAAREGERVGNATLRTLEGEISLLDLFGDGDRLLVIQNMGQGCRWCTVWADGINALLPHLESEFAVALVSKDPPDVQRSFANSRGWRFRMASHDGTDYLAEHSVWPGDEGKDPVNGPGAVFYRRRGEEVRKVNHCGFGPGDSYCALWGLLGLAGIGHDWVPQYRYWHTPDACCMDDGGEDLR